MYSEQSSSSDTVKIQQIEGKEKEHLCFTKKKKEEAAADWLQTVTFLKEVMLIYFDQKRFDA